MKQFLRIFAFVLWPLVACAQSNPGFISNQVLTAPALNAGFSGKLDTPNGTMSGTMVNSGTITGGTIQGAAINGSTFDGGNIGSVTPGGGTFTTLTLTGNGSPTIFSASSSISGPMSFIVRNARVGVTSTLFLLENDAGNTATLELDSHLQSDTVSLSASAGVMSLGGVGVQIGSVGSSGGITISPASGSVQMGAGSKATNATDGFPYMPTSAGQPTGAPTAHTGFAAYEYDTTNHKLWIFDPGTTAWRGVVLN